jgi:hypothetical protein
LRASRLTPRYLALWASADKFVQKPLKSWKVVGTPAPQKGKMGSAPAENWGERNSGWVTWKTSIPRTRTFPNGASSPVNAGEVTVSDSPVSTLGWLTARTGCPSSPVAVTSQ